MLRPKDCPAVLAILGWVLCGGFYLAQPALAQGPAHGPQVVDAHVLMASNGAYPGSTPQAVIVASVAAGYHVNAHKPSFDYLIPTEVKFDTGKNIAVGRTAYPAGKSEKLAFSDDPLSVYQGQFLIGLILRIPAGLAPGTYTLKGRLDYQACNDRACLAPSHVPLSLEVRVVPTSTPLKSENSPVFRQLRMALTK